VLAFVPSWLEVVEPAQREDVFAELRARLDQGAAGGELVLTVPFACVDCTRA
jgi:hypothetical protein